MNLCSILIYNFYLFYLTKNKFAVYYFIIFVAFIMIKKFVLKRRTVSYGAKLAFNYLPVAAVVSVGHDFYI